MSRGSQGTVERLSDGANHRSAVAWARRAQRPLPPQPQGDLPPPAEPRRNQPRPHSSLPRDRDPLPPGALASQIPFIHRPSHRPSVPLSRQQRFVLQLPAAGAAQFERSKLDLGSSLMGATRQVFGCGGASSWSSGGHGGCVSSGVWKRGISSQKLHERL